MDKTRSALFVDFDNLFIGLQAAYGDQAANAFAVNANLWLSWICDQPFYGSEVGRSLLVRRCYMNPRSFGGYRSDLTSAGFEVVDCPPMTTRGKTSTDIHLVLDVIDAMEHRTRFDEFIVLSADTDFAPVLRRLRADDRRTVVIAVGNISPGYRAAADFVVSGDQFVDTLLQPTILAPSIEPISSPSTSSAGELTTFRTKASDIVQSILAARPTMMDTATLALRVRTELGPDAVQKTNWGGAGSFNEFLKTIVGVDLFVSREGTAYAFDPSRHETPAEGEEMPVGRDMLSGLNPDDAAFLRRVHNASGAPLLSPLEHAVVFKAIVDEVRENGYQLTRTSKAVRDRCNIVAQGYPVETRPRIARSDVNFVLIGLPYVGVRLEQDADVTPHGLAEAHQQNVINLCQKEGLQINDAEKVTLEHWIQSETHDADPAPAVL